MSERQYPISGGPRHHHLPIYYQQLIQHEIHNVYASMSYRSHYQHLQSLTHQLYASMSYGPCYHYLPLYQQFIYTSIHPLYALNMDKPYHHCLLSFLSADLNLVPSSASNDCLSYSPDDTLNWMPYLIWFHALYSHFLFLGVFPMCTSLHASPQMQELILQFFCSWTCFKCVFTNTKSGPSTRLWLRQNISEVHWIVEKKIIKYLWPDLWNWFVPIFFDD